MSDNFYPHKTINGKKNTVHRHVMEAHLGRPLEPDEHVYHINGISNDNRIDNLVVIKKKYKKMVQELVRKPEPDKSSGDQKEGHPCNPLDQQEAPASSVDPSNEP